MSISCLPLLLGCASRLPFRSFWVIIAVVNLNRSFRFLPRDAILARYIFFLPDCLHGLVPGPFRLSYSVFVFSFPYFSFLILPLDVLYKNMMSFIKPEVRPEVHNVSQCRQSRIEPRPQVTCTKNLVKFGPWFLRYASGESDKQTNKQTDRQTDRQTDTQIRWWQYCAPVPWAK